MAQFNDYTDISNNPEFMAFMKSEFPTYFNGDVLSIPDVEKNDFLYMFKARQGDLSATEIENLNATRIDIEYADKGDKLDKLIKQQKGWEDKSFDDLSVNEQNYALVCAMHDLNKQMVVDNKSPEVVQELLQIKPKQEEYKKMLEDIVSSGKEVPQPTKAFSELHKDKTGAIRDYIELLIGEENLQESSVLNEKFPQENTTTREDIYTAFDNLVAESGHNISLGQPEKVEPAIHDFLTQKEAYLKDNPEEKDSINKYISDALNQKNDDEQFVLDEYFRIAYGQQEAAFSNSKAKEDIYKAFDDLVAESERNFTLQQPEKIRPDIRVFLDRKDEYLKAHPEDTETVNKYINDALVQKDDDEQFVIDEYFRIAYGQEAANNTNTGNTNTGNTDTGNNKGPTPPLTIGGIDGPDNTNNGPQHPTPSGNDEPSLQTQYEIIEKDIRIRSHDNYDNSTLMYTVELELLHNRKLISDEDFIKANETLLKEIRERDLYNGLPEGQIPEQRVSQADIAAARQLVETSRDKIPQTGVDQYKTELADAILTKAMQQNGERYITLMTPELTAVSIEGYSKALNNKSLKDSEKQPIQIKYNASLNHGEKLLHDLTNKKGYYFSDITNAADEYDGYMHLADVCEEKDIERKKAQNKDKKAEIKAEPHYQQARDLMKDYIKPYDEFYHIPASENAATELAKNPKDTAIKLTSRMADATKIIDKLEFNEDTLGKEYLEAMQNFRFVEEYDGAGRPKYEKSIELNADGKMQVVKGSRLDTALRFAANEGMIQELGNFDKKITKESILEGTKDNAFKTLFAYANSEEVLKKGLKENPQKFTDPKYLKEFTQGLMSGEKPVDVSPLAHDLALKRQTNNLEVYGNRIAGKVGAENAQYLKAGLARQVQKIDGTSKDTKDNAAYLKKKATWRNFGTALMSGGISAAVAYASTKLSLGSSIGNAIGITGSKTAVAGGIGTELAVGGVSALVGAVAGASIATVSYFAVKKVAAMVTRQKYGWKDVKKDLKSSAFRTAVIAGALGGASVGFATSGCAQCALLCGMGSVGVAGAGRYVRSYKDMRLNGHGKAASIAMGALNAISVPIGARLGYDLAMSGVNPNETVTATAEEAKQLYGKNGSNLEQSKQDGWTFESSDHQQPGYTLLDQSKSSVGPYHHYTDQEHIFATGRNDGIRWSEFLNGGKGGLHVQPDFQNGTGGLNHDHALLNNALKSLDDAAKQPGNEWMNSLVNGKPKSNSDMLFYKLYQKVVLMPNDNAQLANGSGTVGDVYNVDASHTANGVFTKLLQGGKLDAQDLAVLHKVEDNIGGEIHQGFNGMGQAPDIVGATHPTKGVDSFTFGDKGYDLKNSETVTNLFGKFTRAVQHVPGFGALFFTLPKKVKQFLRPGAKADRTGIIQEKRPVDTPPVQTPPVQTPPVQTPPVHTPPVQTPPVQTPPVTTVKVNPANMIMDEYQIIYGDNPRVTEGKVDGKNKRVAANPEENKQYKAYEKRVLEEYAATGNGKSLEEFLGERMSKYKETVCDHMANYLSSAEAQRAHKNVLSTNGKIQPTTIEKAKFINNPVTHPVTATIRQNFHESKVGGPDQWTFGGFTSHAKEYLIRPDANKKAHDPSKTTAVNHALLNPSGKRKSRE